MKKGGSEKKGVPYSGKTGGNRSVGGKGKRGKEGVKRRQKGGWFRSLRKSEEGMSEAREVRLHPGGGPFPESQ